MPGEKNVFKQLFFSRIINCADCNLDADEIPNLLLAALYSEYQFRGRSEKEVEKWKLPCDNILCSGNCDRGKYDGLGINTRYSDCGSARLTCAVGAVKDR